MTTGLRVPAIAAGLAGSDLVDAINDRIIRLQQLASVATSTAPTAANTSHIGAGASGGGSSSGAPAPVVNSISLASGNYTAVGPVPTANGQELFWLFTQGTTAHTVTWATTGATFHDAPKIPVDASTRSIVVFVAIAGAWYCTASQLGVSTAL